MAYPTTLDTDTTLYVAVNLKYTTVNNVAGVAIGDTSITVASTSGFPSSGLLRLEAATSSGREFIKYASKTATTFDGLTRGFDTDFPAAAHSNGIEVRYVVQAEHHNALKNALINVQTHLGTGALTNGAMLFMTASKALGNDSANLFWDSSNTMLRTTRAIIGSVSATAPSVAAFAGELALLRADVGGANAIRIIGSRSSDGTAGIVRFENNNPAGTFNNIAQILGLRSGADNTGAITFEVSVAGSLTEAMRITSGQQLAIGTTSTPAAGVYLHISKSIAGTPIISIVENTDNTNGGSHGVLSIKSGGASGGDPHTRYTILGVLEWSTGVDNSDSDKFKIAAAAGPGTSDILTLTTTGHMGLGTTSPNFLGETGTTFSINHASNRSHLELSMSATDPADTTAIGIISFASSGQDASFEGIANIVGQLDGATSGKRGGAIRFGLQQDNSAGIVERFRITNLGSTISAVGTGTSTTRTDGFLYVAVSAGTPTGTPTAFTNVAPIVIDTTNNKLYFYSGGAWRDAGP